MNRGRFQDLISEWYKDTTVSPGLKWLGNDLEMMPNSVLSESAVHLKYQPVLSVNRLAEIQA